MDCSKRERLVGLDVMRIVLALFVFFFHSRMHGADYAAWNPIVSKGMVFMTAFYMLSGFALYYSQGRELDDWVSIKTFYKKRVLSIMPAYWAITIIHPLWNWCSGNGGKKCPNIISYRDIRLAECVSFY